MTRIGWNVEERERVSNAEEPRFSVQRGSLRTAALQAWYQEEGLPRGITIAEFEVYYFLPKYSIYPEVESAAGPSERGFFMYRNATEEEKEQMASRSGRPRTSTSPEERKEARRQYLREWNIKNRRKKAT